MTLKLIAVSSLLILTNCSQGSKIAGELSNSSTNGSSSVPGDTLASCSFNGQTIPDSQSVTAFQASSVAFGQSCSSETRFCSNGTLSGSYGFSSCVVQAALACTFNGVSLASGASTQGYTTSTVPTGSSCVSETVSCLNGVLTPNNAFGTCTITSSPPPAACSFNGETIASGNSVTAYLASSVPSGSSCTSQTRSCSNGTLSGSYTFSSCTVAAAPSPTPTPAPTPNPTPVTIGGNKVINCPNGFSASGSCGVALAWPGGQPFEIFANGGANLSGSTVILQPAGVVHNPNGFNFQTKVNEQAFATSFQFVMNGWNLAFVLSNSTDNPYFNGNQFNAGAGCEGGFYQGYQTAPPNNVFALDFEAHNQMTPSAFTWSNVQIYQQGQSPCLEGESSSGLAPFYYPINKVSTYPVLFNLTNSNAAQQTTFTGHTYSATIIYTGTNLVLNLYDVDAGGTCTPSTSPSCFTYTWNGVSIPSLVDGTTAWAGFTGTTNGASAANLVVKNWIYSVLSPAAAPTISGSQSATITDSSSGAIICYNTTGNPATNGTTGCANGKLYTGAIPPTSSQTIFAVAGGAGYADSTVVSSAFKIGATASQPTFFPASGIYQGNQTVFLSAQQGSVICYNTTGDPAVNGSGGCSAGTLYNGPITVAANETIFAVSGGAGFTASSVGSAAYTISPYASLDSGKFYPPANSPTFSPLPGSFTSAQSVKLSTTTSGANICYVVSATPPTLLPEPDSLGGCSVGTLYTGAITISATQTVYAAAGTTIGSMINGTGAPSSVSQATYTISGP